MVLYFKQGVDLPPSDTTSVETTEIIKYQIRNLSYAKKFIRYVTNST